MTFRWLRRRQIRRLLRQLALADQVVSECRAEFGEFRAMAIREPSAARLAWVNWARIELACAIRDRRELARRILEVSRR